MPALCVKKFNFFYVKILTTVREKLTFSAVKCDLMTKKYALVIGNSTYQYKDDWPELPDEVFKHLREVPHYDRVGASFVSHLVTDLDRPRIAERKRNGAKILCWTVTSAEQEAEARKVADNITFEGYAAATPFP